MTKKASSPALYPLPFYAVRNISAPEDIEAGRKVLAGQTPIAAILNLNTNENVRDFLLEAEGKRRPRPTQVHQAIRSTLTDRPDVFSILNGGITLVARDHEIDEKEKVIRLLEPSIINGAQTQGIIREFAKDLEAEGKPLPNAHVKFEIIVTDDDDLVADVSIARNFQNDVAPVSIVGRKGQLDELEAALQRGLGEDVALRKSESKFVRSLSLKEDYLWTEKLIQVITALVPDELWWGPGQGDAPNKAYTYSAKARCLKDFSKAYEIAHDKKHPEHADYAARYQFYLDIAPQAVQLYDEWRAHQGFAGTGLRSIKRTNGAIDEVPDGIVFPILASLSAFARKTPKGWRILTPSQLRDDDLIGEAKRAYINIARSNPNTMGKSYACYSALYAITSLMARLVKDSPELFDK